MKRPTEIGGRALPKDTGRCALCGERIGTPGEGSVRLVHPRAGAGGSAKFRLVCRDEAGCRERRGLTPPTAPRIGEHERNP